jgi:hypothetical protein
LVQDGQTYKGSMFDSIWSLQMNTNGQRS